MIQQTTIQDPHNWAPANLQNGDIFINKKNSCGVISLSAAKNEIYEAEPGSGEWLITMAGYEACNVSAGVQCVKPDSLMLPDGRIVGNPYVERDEKTGSSQRFTAKYLSFGKNSLSGVHIESSTIIFDARLTFIEELSRAMEKNKDIGRYYMEGKLTDEESFYGIYYPIDGEMWIWADPRLPEVTAINNRYIANKNNGDKTVVTKAHKAALQRQPCMPPPRVKAIGGVVTVLVGKPITNFSESELISMAKEYTESGKVSGAEVIESSEDISKADDLENFSFVNYEGSPRF